MGASTGTATAMAATAMFLVASQAPSTTSSILHVHSFSHTATTIRAHRSTPTALLRRRRITPSSLDRALRKRPRCLASKETDLEDAPVVNTQFTSHDNDIGKRDHENTTTPPTTSNPLLKKLFLGIDPTPDIIAISTIYFVEGALGLARLAQTFLLKEDLHMGPAEMSATKGIGPLYQSDAADE